MSFALKFASTKSTRCTCDLQPKSRFSKKDFMYYINSRFLIPSGAIEPQRLNGSQAHVRAGVERADDRARQQQRRLGERISDALREACRNGDEVGGGVFTSDPFQKRGRHRISMRAHFHVTAKGVSPCTCPREFPARRCYNFRREPQEHHDGHGRRTSSSLCRQAQAAALRRQGRDPASAMPAV